MAQRQAKVTDFFQHRRKAAQSPSAKRVKFEETTSILETKEKIWSLPPNTPDIPLVVRPTDLSAKKRKNVHKSPVGDTIVVPTSVSSSAKRQLKFTKVRRRLSGDKTEDNANDVVASLKFRTLEPSSTASPITIKTPVKSLSSPTKFSIEDVRKNLGKVRNLQDLRQRLATFSETAARLNELVDARNVEISKLPDLSTTSKPSDDGTGGKTQKKVLSDDDYIPAYQRYAHLVSNNFNANLETPVNRKFLFDNFRAADQLVSIMYNRMELITYDKLKSGIQQMTRKNFEKSHLGQIKTVYPEAYNLEQMKVATKFGRSDEYFLTIAPNLTTDLKSYQINTPSKTPMKRQTASDERTPPSSPIKSYMNRTPNKTPLLSFRSPSKIFLPNRSPQKTTPTKSDAADRLKPMSGARLVCRAEIFKKNLLVLLNEEHNKFLATLSPPIVLTADEQASLQRWHPKFNLNTLPDVVAAELPQPPFVEKVYTAKDILEKQKTKQFLPLEVENALKKITVDSPTSSNDAESPSSSKKSSIKGIPTNLLDKIRAKESLKIQRNLVRSPEEDLKRQRLSRLPEMIKILKMYFATENKTVLQQDLVAKKLHDSYKSLISKAEIDNHIKLLLDHASEWLTQTTVREKGIYLRVNKTCAVNNVLEKLTKMIDSFDK